MGFATQNLENPISNFGHTFLVFHNSNPPEAESLIVEFTGEAHNTTDAISALFTSIPGQYGPNYLSEKIREYDYENRSIWLYKLRINHDEFEKLKQYFISSENKIFEYDFSQKNCAYYIARALSHSLNDLPHYKSGLFVTPVNTLQWIRSKDLFTYHTFLPSSQLKALHRFEELPAVEQPIAINFLNQPTFKEPESTSQSLKYAYSAITEHLVPREESINKRNLLYAIKRAFPSDPPIQSNEFNIQDPSYSTGQSTIAAQILPIKNASIIIFSPGFIRLENEAATGQKNSRVEALTLEIYADTSGVSRVENFYPIRLEANQPSSYLKAGFTHTFSISYTNYFTFLDTNYSETKILFGKGASWTYFENTISILPIISIISSRLEDSISNYGQLELRVNIYKQLNELLTYSIQYNRSILNQTDIKQSANLELIHPIGKSFSIAFNGHNIEGLQKSSTLYGIRFAASF